MVWGSLWLFINLFKIWKISHIGAVGIFLVYLRQLKSLFITEKMACFFCYYVIFVLQLMRRKIRKRCPHYHMSTKKYKNGQKNNFMCRSSREESNDSKLFRNAKLWMRLYWPHPNFEICRWGPFCDQNRLRTWCNDSNRNTVLLYSFIESLGVYSVICKFM